MSKELMCEAYSLLYDTEIKLKEIIEKGMVQTYGLHWKGKLKEKNISSCNFPELMAFFHKYPTALPTIDERSRLRLIKLSEIRNKICHMNDITIKDFVELVECRVIVFTLAKKRVRKKKLLAVKMAAT